MREVAAVLAGEPWCYRPWEIRRVSLTWFYGVVLHPRDGKTHQITRTRRGRDEGAEDARDGFFRLWRMRRLPDHLVERKWREWCEQQQG